MKTHIARNKKKKAVQEYKEVNKLSSREFNKNLIQFQEKTSVNSKLRVITSAKEEETTNAD